MVNSASDAGRFHTLYNEAFSMSSNDELSDNAQKVLKMGGLSDPGSRENFANAFKKGLKEGDITPNDAKIIFKALNEKLGVQGPKDNPTENPKKFGFMSRWAKAEIRLATLMDNFATRGVGQNMLQNQRNHESNISTQHSAQQQSVSICLEDFCDALNAARKAKGGSGGGGASDGQNFIDIVDKGDLTKQEATHMLRHLTPQKSEGVLDFDASTKEGQIKCLTEGFNIDAKTAGKIVGKGNKPQEAIKFLAKNFGTIARIDHVASEAIRGGGGGSSGVVGDEAGRLSGQSTPRASDNFDLSNLPPIEDIPTVEVAPPPPVSSTSASSFEDLEKIADLTNTEISAVFKTNHSVMALIERAPSSVRHIANKFTSNPPSSEITAKDTEIGKSIILLSKLSSGRRKNYKQLIKANAESPYASNLADSGVIKNMTLEAKIESLSPGHIDRLPKQPNTREELVGILADLQKTR